MGTPSVWLLCQGQQDEKAWEENVDNKNIDKCGLLIRRSVRDSMTRCSLSCRQMDQVPELKLMWVEQELSKNAVVGEGHC